MEKLNYTYHNTFYYISGLDIELPCEYTLYCSPGSAVEYDMDLTLSAKVAYDNGKYASDQLIGSAVVKRPGAYLDTLSAYVNREEIQVSGRAQPFEEVTVFDNDVLVGGAAADKWGEWTAQVTLSGVSAADATTHILTSRSASGEESDELWILHDSDGPQLTSFTMTWTEWGTRTINVGDPYTFYGSAMRDVTFTAVIDNPDALEVMTEWGPNVKAVTKVFTTDGEIRFLPMTQDGDTFTGRVDTALRDSVTYAELMYVPAAEETAVTAETVETVAPVSTSELDGLVPDSGSVEALTPADDWSVTFDGDVPTLSGNTEGLSSDEFQQAADNLRQKGFQIRSITMMHDVSGTEHSTLAWLNSIYEQRLADETDHDVVYTFAGALDSKEAFDNAVENIRKIAVDTHGTGEGILPFRITDAAGHTVYRFILTDAWTYEGETTYTYFIYAIFLESTEGGKTAYTANIYVQLAEDFVGYFRLPAGDDPEVTGLLSEPGELYTDSSLTRLMGHLTTGTSSGISSDNGPMYGYPADRQDLKEMEASASGPPPKPSEKYYGKFDLNKVESYTQKQQNMLEDVTANGSGMFGLVGDGAGWIGNALGVASYIKTIERRSRYSGYVSDMRDEIWNLETKPCFSALNSTQKSLVKKLIREIDQAWAGYQLSCFSANLTDLGINLAAIGGGLSGFTWKKGAALAAGVYTSGKVNGSANDKVFNRFVEKYEHSYKTIDSMYRNAAASTGNPDCKKDEKSKHSNTNKVRTSEGGPIPQNNDPSGVVYEGVIQNPVEGAKVTLYYAANSAGNIVREGTTVNAETGKKTGTGSVEPGNAVSNLKAAEDVRYLLPQEAVQLTGENGRFSWGVPEGLWYVTAQYAGLEGNSNADKAAKVSVSGLTLDGEAVTNLLPVLPVQLDVNIPLVDATAPVVEDMRFTEEGIYVTFSKYMEDMAGDNTSVLTAGNYVLTDAEENPVALTVISEVQGNTPDNLRGAEAKTFTKTVHLTPAGGSFPAGELTLTVAGTVTSYAGTAMGLNCVETAQVSPMVQLGKPTFGLASGTTVQRGDTVSISLPADAPEGARICYTTDGSDPAAGKVYDGPVAVTDDMTIRAVAVCTGWQSSDAASASFTVAKAKTSEEIQGSVTVSVTDGGLSARVVPPFRETFAAGFCAAYDKDGKMLAVQPLSNAGGEQTLTLPCDAGKACTVKVFLLDSKSCPVTKPLTWIKSE